MGQLRSESGPIKAAFISMHNPGKMVVSEGWLKKGLSQFPEVTKKGISGGLQYNIKQAMIISGLGIKIGTLKK